MSPRTPRSVRGLFSFCFQRPFSQRAHLVHELRTKFTNCRNRAEAVRGLQSSSATNSLGGRTAAAQDFEHAVHVMKGHESMHRPSLHRLAPAAATLLGLAAFAAPSYAAGGGGGGGAAGAGGEIVYNTASV